MKSGHATIVGAPPVLSPGDIVAGLGSAPRDFLCACLALFDDSTLQRRINTLIDKWKSNRTSSKEVAESEAAAAVKCSLDTWRESKLTDDELRVLLWMYLREALELPPLTFASLRAADTAADDLVARALHSIQPGRAAKLAEMYGLKEPRDLPTTLDSLARKTMEELMSSFLQATDAESKQAREDLLSETRARLSQLPAEDRQRLMGAVGSDELNDAALRKILITGGGLGAFGASVGLAGFSAYILAAQASAFIPLVSGPALVSVVAVLSNPITIVAATVGMGWWATRSANQQVRSGIAIRVVSLLALNGLDAGFAGTRAMPDAFSALKTMRESGGLPPEVLASYRADWKLIEPVRRRASNLDPRVAGLFERPISIDQSSDRLRGLVDDRRRERREDVVLAGLTLGDILYSAWSLNPMVLGAADFSRVEDLDDPIAFSAFAHKIEVMHSDAATGAISNLKGYVAERVVAAQLMEQGHVVEFPETSNQAGWDISVDGTKYQVKDVGDLSSLKNHFDRGYDYPVIANSELAGQLSERYGDSPPEWTNQIHFVEGYSNNVVEHVSRSSIEAGDDMLHPDVPLFVMALSGIRNLERVNRNEITGTQALQEVLLDGGTRAGLAVAGNYAGVGVGLLVFGPAGALVLGAVVPILTQRQSGAIKSAMDGLIKDKTYLVWEASARAALSRLIEKADDLLREKSALLKARQPEATPAAISSYINGRIDDEIAFLREAWCRLKSIRDDKSSSVEISTQRTISWLSTSTLFPHTYQAELKDLSTLFQSRPSTADRVTVALSDVTEKTVAATKKARESIGEWLSTKLRKE